MFSFRKKGKRRKNGEQNGHKHPWYRLRDSEYRDSQAIRG